MVFGVFFWENVSYDSGCWLCFFGPTDRLKEGGYLLNEFDFISRLAAAFAQDRDSSTTDEGFFQGDL